MKNSLSPVGHKPEARGSAPSAAHLSPFLTPVDAQLLPAPTILCLADRIFVRNMAGGLLGLGRRAYRDACRGRVMDDKSGESSRRPISLALACVAAVGWLIAATVWWQSSETQSQLNQSLTAAERARESLASDLQNLQKTAGTAADLKKQAADAEKALSDASAARASAQNELADLTKQINDAKLAISGAQEEASAKTRDLQAVELEAEGRNRPRCDAWEPGSGPFNRAVSPPGRRRDGAQGSRGGSDRDRRRAEGLPGASGPDQRGERRAQRHRGANSRRKAGTEFDPTQPEPVTGSPDVGASLVHGDCAARRPVFKHRMAGKSRGPRRARPQRRRLHG